MNKQIKFLIYVLFFSLTFTSSVLSAPWVNLKLTYDYSVHNYNAESVYIKINGNELTQLDMPPIIMNNMTLVPAREVLEPLGAVIDWKKDTEELFVAYEDNIVIIKIGSVSANCNGIIKEMTLAPKIINNKTMVPVRFISEVLGFEVNWIDAERTIYINSPEKIDLPTVTTQQQTVATTVNNNVSDEITNSYFNAQDEIITETLSESTTQSIALSGNINTANLNSSALTEINFNDDFYYDRNMKNLVISLSYFANGADSVVQHEDKSSKKHYFSFKSEVDNGISSGFYQIDDESISRIDIFTDNDSVIICFNEKSEVGYKVYEEQGYVYFKPFI